MDSNDGKVSQLLEIMPETPPRMWTVKNFQEFLEFLELDHLKAPFEKESIDGSVFFDIEKSEWEGITSRPFHIMKLQSWQRYLTDVQEKREKNYKLLKKKTPKPNEKSKNDQATEAKAQKEKKKDGKPKAEEDKRKSVAEEVKEKEKPKKKPLRRRNSDSSSSEKPKKQSAQKQPKQKSSSSSDEEPLKNPPPKKDATKTPKNEPHKNPKDEPPKKKESKNPEPPKNPLQRQASDSGESDTEDWRGEKPVIKCNIGKKRITLFFKNFSENMDLVEKNGFIGRDKDNFVAIFDREHKEVSRKHCEIVFEESGFLLRDNRSLNGTYVFFPNGSELYVKNGTTVMMGSFMYEFQGIKEINDKDGKKFQILQYREDLNKVDATYSFDLGKQGDVLIGSDPILKELHLHVTDDEKMEATHCHISAKNKCNMISIKPMKSSGVGYNYYFLVSSSYVRPFEKTTKGKQCLGCGQEERNVLVIPCLHKSLGMKCLSERKVTSCPECFKFIHNYTRIFTD